MKKNLFVVIIMTAVVALTGSYAWLNRASLQERPGSLDFEFSFPYYAARDSQDTIYLIDNGSKRITAMDPGGNVEYTIAGSSRRPGSFYYAVMLGLDSADRLYVLNARPNLHDGSTEREEILRFLPNGRFEKIILGRDYSADEQAEIGGGLGILGFQIVKDTLYYVQDLSGTLSLYRVDPDLGLEEALFSIPSDRSFVDFTGTDRRNTLFTRKDGLIYRTRVLGDDQDREQQAIDSMLASAASRFIRPTGVVMTPDGDLYVSDMVQQGIYVLKKDGAIRSVLDRDILRAAGYPAGNLLLEYFHLRPDGAVTAVDRYNKSVIAMNPDGSVQTVLNSGINSNTVIFLNFTVWASVILFGVCAFLVIAFVYVRILEKKFPIILKHIFVFSPLIIGSVLYISSTVYTQIFSRYEQEISRGLQGITTLAAQLVNGDDLEKLDTPAAFGSGEYVRVRDQMNHILASYSEPWSETLFAALFLVQNGVYYYSYTSSEYYGVMYPYFEIQEEHQEAFENSRVGVARYYDEFGGYLAGVAPVRNSQGDNIGILEVGLSMDILQEVNSKYTRSVFLGILVIMLVFVAAFSLITYLLLISIRILRNAVNRVANGDLEVSIGIRSRDEIGDLGRDFNTMSSQLKKQITEIIELNKANARFVPTEFLSNLNRESILDMRLGDQVQKEMTVLFSDIRSFTTLSESMTPKENFDFLNAYLRRMGPIIRENNGFIDKYIGDAIMALFPDHPDDAISAGVMMRKTLHSYNMQRQSDGYPPIDCGIGIHTGSIMLGIVGEEERFDGTVISDAVNLASRIEGLTKLYDTGMIISESTFLKARCREDMKYEYRFLDIVFVHGKHTAVSLYEILDADTDQVTNPKIRTRKSFELGVKLYKARRFAEALKVFTAIQKENPADAAARIYSRRCADYMDRELPANWNGAVDILHK
jgi:adenylate cyclase